MYLLCYTFIIVLAYTPSTYKKIKVYIEQPQQVSQEETAAPRGS